MGSMSPLHWLIVLAVVLILFGGGSKISGLMGDFAKGIKSFKKNMAEDESMEPKHDQPNGQISPPPQGNFQQPQYTPPVSGGNVNNVNH
ncbi:MULTISPECIES: twin-arginine translocase TatA/TatE family subunit [Asaia]|uniref:Sec-independent protein translocase protein TatA n=2 Tax=Asaia TaxID=91914 RepID=A0ABQ1M535_9PROT|nr:MULTISPECIES: twin-arginine translocase TatA/TatE family subunit [Asaia]GBR06192.1 Sec-independent protein translocase protein TatA [Asaia siamensis NRIC 0323]GBR12318.1 Sec-independent protein translocase protein TatA [Asaia spathodeae NBRC 105894]GGC34914.1 Sec-independent protein translocase protein TatA [Asaia siamensis]